MMMALRSTHVLKEYDFLLSYLPFTLVLNHPYASNVYVDKMTALRATEVFLLLRWQHPRLILIKFSASQN